MSNIAKTNRINIYKLQIDELHKNCSNINSEAEFRELFKGIVIMFINDMILMYDKLLTKIPTLKNSVSSEKITYLKILLDALNGDGMLFGVECNELMIRAYLNYFWTPYRDYMMDWDLSNIQYINESNVKNAIVDTASKENLLDTALENLNIIPEIMMMKDNLSERDILKILFLLNNLNTIIDVYLYKKSLNQLN